MVTRFSEFELDERLYQLRRDGVVVKLEPKVFDLLRYLVESRERVVSKEELLEKVWPGEYVSESVLPSNVRTLRRLLGDDRTGQRFIQTVYGRGYRFVAEVEPDGVASATEAGGDPHGPFVGREGVLATLREALDGAFAGRGGLVLLVGDAGIGKTRTAQEIAREARERGARVLAAQSHDSEGVPAFWLWVQVLRAAVSGTEPDALRAMLAHDAAPIAGLVAEVADLLPEVRVPSDLASAKSRFRLFDAVARYLERASRAQPLVVVLDDLHFTDKPSLALLRFAARELRESAVLVIGTLRDEELRRGHPLLPLIGEVAREPQSRRVRLQGLERGDVARYLEQVAPSRAEPGLIADLHERTAGNPFFLREMVDLLVAEPGLSPSRVMPEGVREAIGRRLDRLSADANRVLTAGSFLGPEMSLPLLEKLVELPRAPLLELLDEAVERGVLALSGAPGRYVFEHALVRETLYAEVPTPLRIRMHRRVGEALEDAHADTLGAHLSELAHHFYQAAAGGEGEREKAIRYGQLAADRAMRLLAWEEGAAHFERVLELQGLAVPTDERTRCETLLSLGDAYSRAGERDRARATFAQAGGLARELGDAELLAHAALGLGGRAEELHGRDERLRALLEDALAAVGEGDSALRAALLARLSGTHPYSGRPRERSRLSAEAVEIARRVGSTWALTQAIVSRHFDLSPARDVEERLETGAELLRAARRPEDTSRVRELYDPSWVGHTYRHRAFLLLGDITSADHELAEMSRIADEQRQPYQRFEVSVSRFGRAHASGRFADARKWIAEMLRVAERMDPLAGFLAPMLEFLLARECGPQHLPRIMAHPEQVYEMRTIALGWMGLDDTSITAETPHERLRELMRTAAPWMVPVSTALIAHTRMQMGLLDEAKVELDSLAELYLEGEWAVWDQQGWLFIVALAAEVALAAKDLARAERIYALLAPHSDQNVVHEGLPAYLGSASHFLGLLAAALSRRGQAIAHLEAALEQNERMGAWAHVARTRLALGRTLGTRSAGRGRELEQAGRRAAQNLGMEPLLQR